MKIPRKYTVIAIVVGVLAISLTAYAGYFTNRVVPNTFVGDVALGELTRDQVAEHLQARIDQLSHDGIQVMINDTPEEIQLDDIGFDINLSQAVDVVFARGHGASVLVNTWERISGLWSGKKIEVPVHLDQARLDIQLGQIAAAVNAPRQDVRLSVSGATVRLLTDTKPGRVIDYDQATRAVTHALSELGGGPISLSLRDDLPVADPMLASTALVSAQKMVSRGILLSYEDAQFSITRSQIGTWITSEYDGPQLKASVSHVAIATYVTGIAKALNVAPQPPHITTDGGRVTGFTPSRVGRAVQEDKLIEMITSSIFARTGTDKLGDSIVVPMKTTTMSLTGLDSGVGITEIIGKATTPFTGSPKNRITNIKNGVKFISGTIIQPGQEFSTLGTLGTIDNTTGYLPELVIKGDRTTPDFGGGLCQVSTTLFRAVMNAGLPVTARRNHSYRVTYYEKDGDGKVIGPGLDATIYEPDLDFKFRNDTATPVLIIGYVVGDKVTFELYGTKDGRIGAIDGPHLLTQTAPGETILIPTDTLPMGMKKQVETPHPGGSATATYLVTYADGHVAKQVFNSYYRRWPAQYLVGTNTACTTAAQCAALVATPTPLPVTAP